MFGDIFVHHAHTRQILYSLDLSSLARSPISTEVPIFDAHVIDIFSWRADEQMIWIDAFAVIALMKNQLTRSQIPTEKHPRSPMCGYLAGAAREVSVMDSSIPAGGLITYPVPASIIVWIGTMLLKSI